ncbi:hypothetical protein [Pleionea litopenaei]|uniref:Thioredoxin-like fold domain-containing protein n=1 Tax=Pleionea litopenaei TaxID=3070815 RepID=A0AA51RRJ8_9GAMM|nr:hypothetical protein [Pleionea sp. HL-JVS1]WMS86164.1 hypothetical protein Q9312_13140 [Pleionea sp. HL-JVS1]
MKLSSFVLFAVFTTVFSISAEEAVVPAKSKIQPRSLEAPLVENETTKVVCWYRSRACGAIIHSLDQAGMTVTLWPAIFRQAWQRDAKLMLIANKLNFSAEQHLAIMQQLNTATPSLEKPEDYIELLISMYPELDQAELEQVVYDTSLAKQLKGYQKQIQDYAITQVPTIIYKGQLIIDAEQLQTPQQLIDWLNQQSLSE